jgi:hypothetical protein
MKSKLVRWFRWIAPVECRLALIHPDSATLVFLSPRRLQAHLPWRQRRLNSATQRRGDEEANSGEMRRLDSHAKLPLTV